MIRLFISLVIVLALASCSDSDNKKGNNASSEVVADYVQVDSPNSFIPLGIGITVAPPEHGQNAKYFIANKDVAEVNFDYMNNNYTYRASKNTYYILSTQAEDDKDLTNLSSLYIKSIHWNKDK